MTGATGASPSCGMSAPGTTTEPPSDADVDFFNSTELRLVMLGGGGGTPVEVQGRERTLRLPGETEANGRAWCS